jgi:hypothetical protein
MSKRSSRRGQSKRLTSPPDPTPTKTPPLTPQELSYLFSYFCTRNHAAAARMVGLRGRNPSQAGKRTLDRILSKCSLLGIMDHLGLDNISLLKSLWLGLEANLVKVATYKGLILDERSYPDWGTRLPYLRLLAQLKGLLTMPGSEYPPTGTTEVRWIDEAGEEEEPFDLEDLQLPAGMTAGDLGLKDE